MSLTLRVGAADGYGAGMDVAHIPDRAETIDIWQAELEAIADLAASLDDDQWLAASPCPGWSVADLVAHITDIELTLTDDPRPDHVPDWSSLPHVSSDTDRFTEVGVDLRRGRPRAEVIGELREVIARRRAELDALPKDAQMHSPTGRPVDVQRMIRLRTLDSWVHEQDIRTAVGRPGGWDTPAAIVTMQQFIDGLPKVWAKQAQAPADAVLHVVIADVGRGVEAWVVSDGDGRGEVCAPVPEADVTLTLSFTDFEQLCAGRAPVEEVGPRVAVSGDPALVERVLHSMTLTP